MINTIYMKRLIMNRYDPELINEIMENPEMQKPLADRNMDAVMRLLEETGAQIVYDL